MEDRYGGVEAEARVVLLGFSAWTILAFFGGVPRQRWGPLVLKSVALARNSDEAQLEQLEEKMRN